MKESTEHWTLEEFNEYKKTGVKPARKYIRPEVPEWIKEMLSKACNSPEKELQQACEGWLGLQGCLRMTANLAESACFRDDYAKYYQTWFGHMTDTKATLQKNVFLPDLFILNPTRPPLLVELKVRNEFKAGQLEMILMGYWKLACTLEQFIKVYEEWNV